MLLDSNIEIKLSNSAILLHYNNKEMDLLSNYKDKYNEINKKYIKLSNIKNLFFNDKTTKNLQFYEKYAKNVFINKYSNSSDFYNIKVIDDIISNEPTHTVAEFKDYLIYGDNSEFLHNFYDISESNKYLPKLYDYYLKCSVIFPNYVILPENKYIFKNIKRKQKVIDIQFEQENKKEQILKGEIEIEDNDDIFSTRTIYTILNQTNTSNIKKLFDFNKKRSNNNIDKINNDDTSMKKLIDLIKKEEKKNKEKKKILAKIIKKKQILHIKSGLKLKFKSKLINNINLKINLKGRNYKTKSDISNCNNRNNNFFSTNINFKNCTINNVKNIHKNAHFKSRSKSKILNSVKLKDYINNNNSNNINKIKNNKNYIYSIISDSKKNHISTKKNSNGNKTIRIHSKKHNNKYIYNRSNNNSSIKNKKTIQQYFKRKISPKAVIVKMITEHSNKNNLISSINRPKNNKKEKEIIFMKKRAVSLTPSLTNMKMASHKTKKIFNRNIITNNNSKHKNKVIESKKQKNNIKFKSIILKEINNSNSNYNADLINSNNYNAISNNNTNNIINDNNLNINNNNNRKRDISMNLYKVNSFSRIKKSKEIKQNLNIKPNKHNSTLTGQTTTCSYLKHSSIYYDKKSSKSVNKKPTFHKKDILIHEQNFNKRINKRKSHNIISKQFPINISNSNINIRNNKINNNNIINTENIYSKYFSKNILSSSPSIGYSANKKNILCEKQFKKNSGIFPYKKVYFNIKGNGSPLTIKMSNTSRTRIMKKIIINEKIYSTHDKNKIIKLKDINNSWNLKSVKNIKDQKNNSSINKKIYMNTYYGYFKQKK